MPIERDLHDLLHDHDCVIVPRFGGFLTHYRSARIDTARNLVHPPGKDLSFNRHLVRTDGLLADRVGRREGLDFRQAHAVIDGEVDAWMAKLDRQGRLEVPRIGTFFRDGEGNLQFDPDRHVNYLKDAFGLRPLAAVPLAVPETRKEARVVPLPPPPVHRDPVSERSGVSTFAVAASIAALLMTAATWIIVSGDRPGTAAWAGLDPFADSGTPQYTPRTEPPVQELPLAVVPSIALPDTGHGLVELSLGTEAVPLMVVDLGAEPAAARIAPPESTAVAMPAPQRRYHVIGGCFLLEENAETFVAELQARGFAASILDQQGGLYRVAYGSYPERSLALEALDAVRKEEAPEAWLLTK
jgi:cell division septation protein DedD